MGLPKGKTNNPNGRGKGVKTKKTKAWEQIGDFLTEAGAQRAKKIMDKADDDSFMRYYAMFLEYFKPKQQRQTIVGEEGSPVVINIIRPNESASDS